MPKLTAKSVASAGAGRHGDGEGLYLLVSKTGSKSWLLRCMVNGKRKDIGLGSASMFTLAESRDKARELRKVAKQGGDPIAHRDKGKKAIPTFQEAAIECHAAKASGWSSKSAAAFLSSLELHVYPALGPKRVDSIDAQDVAGVLAKTWAEKPSVGVKLRHRIGLVLDYSKAKRWRSEPSPRESLRALLPKRTKEGSFASMPYSKAPAYVASLKQADQTMGRMALLFTIFTAARSGEVRKARWSHIDRGAKLWRRPAELMRKTGRSHVVTLSKQALAILDQVEAARTNNDDCLIFPSTTGRSLSDMTLSKIVRPTGFTVHGFRSTFKTWAVESLPSIPEAVSEAALAHLIPDKVERAYNKANFLDMRRTLLDAWGRYASGESAEVIDFPMGEKTSA